jgi:hypothetical protein
MMRCFEIMPQASRVFTFSQSKAMKAPLDMSVGYWAKIHLKLLNMLKEKNVMRQKIPEKKNSV